MFLPELRTMQDSLLFHVGVHGWPFQLLGDTLTRFVSQLLYFYGNERRCAGAGLARILDFIQVTNSWTDRQKIIKIAWFSLTIQENNHEIRFRGSG